MHIGTFRCRCWNDLYCAALLCINLLPLTDDASDVIPHRQAVGLSFLPAVVVAQVERKPEEEGVVDQLQTRIRQGILQHKQSTWCENCIISSSFVVKTFKDLSWLVPTCGLTGSTPGRRKAWQKLMGLDDLARGSFGCWVDWHWLLYTSTSSSSSLIRGWWLSVSVSTGPSTVSDSMLKPDPQRV